MKPKIQVHIPQPCHENWNNMSPVDKGRFCQSCSKQVIDFSVMTDNEIINHLTRSAGHLCGRFAETQLQRPLQPTVINKKQSWWIALTMPLLLLFDKAGAQKKLCSKTKGKVSYIKRQVLTGDIEVVPVSSTTSDTIFQPQKPLLIQGNVINENGLPVAYANVFLKETNQTTQSDSLGLFKINLDKKIDSISLEVSSIGYQTKTAVINKNDNDAKIVLTSITNQLPEVCVISYGIVGKMVRMGGIASVTVTKIDTIQTFIRKAFHQEAFKIFPNPALRGAPIKVDVKKTGAYSIQLIDAKSNFITAIPFDALVGSTIANFSLPSNITAGVYYIIVRNEQTKKQYSDKILIQ